MMLETIAFLVAILGSTVAGLWDLKTTDIPDSVCIGMIVIGLLINFMIGNSTGNYDFLFKSLMYGGMFLLFGLFMYYSGQWGGGDGELLVAIGVLMPISTVYKTIFPFAVSYFVNLLFVGVIYTMIYILYLIAKDKSLMKRIVCCFDKDRKFIGILFAMFIIFIIMIISPAIFFDLSILMGLLIILLAFYKISREVEKGFYSKISVKDLKEGDMIGQDIKELNISKTKIKGLTKQEVLKICKIRKFVLIRDGVRFGPVFALTLLATVLYGDLFLFII